MHLQALVALVCLISCTRTSSSYEGQRLNRIPYFTLIPTNGKYREGSAAELKCIATGKPEPLIAWKFKDNDLVPSKKYTFSEGNTKLKIFPFQRSDIGRYQCTGINVNGEVSHIFNLEIVENSAPILVDRPQSKVIQPGSRLLLICRAIGEPMPEIQWMFNGKEINAEDAHVELLKNNSELLILHTTRGDTGEYSCIARNLMGIKIERADVKIESEVQGRIDQALNASILESIVNEARKNVDRAITESRSMLSKPITSPWEFMKLFRFRAPQNLELAKAREIYEQSVLLAQKHIREGLNLSMQDLSSNFSFESTLAVSHIQTIMELSGCVTGLFRKSCNHMCFHSKYRSYDGQCNNMDHPFWGVAQTPFRRNLPPIYENGFNTPVGWDPNKVYFGFKKPNPRLVSLNIVSTVAVTPHHGFTAMMKQWGQFLAHDIEQTAPGLARQTYMKGAICNETCEHHDPCYNIPLPPGDKMLRHKKKPQIPCIEVERSSATCGSGLTGPIYRQLTYREQMNILTSYIDGSAIYGSAEVDALDLRDLFGDHGFLRFDIVSAAQKPYLPFERESSMECRRNRSRSNPISCFLAGDYRANEQLALLSMHTLWFREHNRIAAQFLEINPHWDGETIYQETRKIIGAMIQVITFEYWLPKVLGPDGYAELIGPYTGYDPRVNPTLANSFSAAAFRFGHTLVNPILYRLNKEFEEIEEGHIPLHEAFFAPERLLSEGGIDPLLRGLFAMPMKLPKAEQLLNSELTQKLFSRVEESMFDLAAINIQRGRDHGLPGYIEFRRWCNFTVPETWDELLIDIPNQAVLRKLEELYGHPGNIDIWVGLISEKRLAGALVGPTISCILSDQFKRLRSGDRFWYENDGVFTKLQLHEIRKSSLAAVLCNNGDDIDRVQEDVFDYIAGRPMNFYRNCSETRQINLNVWQSCCQRSCDAMASENLRKKRSLGSELYVSKYDEDEQMKPIKEA